MKILELLYLHMFLSTVISYRNRPITNNLNVFLLSELTLTEYCQAESKNILQCFFLSISKDLLIGVFTDYN